MYECGSQGSGRRINWIYILGYAFILAFIIISILYWKDIYHILSDEERFKEWIKGFGRLGFLVFILVQMLQVVIFIIPGEVVQIAGGYVYGTIPGTLLSVTGITMGSLICFQTARVLGRGFVEGVVPKNTLEKIDDLINTPKGLVPLFLMFLMPGFPKDALSYAAGLTQVKFPSFFIITLIARFPGIFFSSYFGTNLARHNYLLGGAIAAAAIIIFAAGTLYGEKIIKKLEAALRKTWH